MSKVKKIIGACLIVLCLVGCGMVLASLKERADENEGLYVVSSGFVGYDFARAIVGDEGKIEMLLKPGADLHHYEPTPEDILKIKKADLFVYVGGESEEWIAELLDNNDISEKNTLKLMDLVEVKNEEVVEGMEAGRGEADEYGETGGGEDGGPVGEVEDEDGEENEETEYDEHVWTSPINAARIVVGMMKKLSEIAPEKAEVFDEQANAYVDKILAVDDEIWEVVENAGTKELIFADRFPFRYFVDEFELKYYAAFPGCAEQTEASSGTIGFLIDKVKQDGVGVILKIELSDGKLAEAISEETGAKVLTLNSAHNISQSDFEAGVTYVDIMKNNVEVLKEALK